MTIRVMRKGDHVINVTSEFVAIERKNGEVDIIPLHKDGETFRLDAENVVKNVRLAAHVSNGLKSRIRPVVGRI
jgi:hypothetical protein